MDKWNVGDPSDWGDSIGVPDKAYMGSLNGGNDDDYEGAVESFLESMRMKSAVAHRFKMNGNYHEAGRLYKEVVDEIERKKNILMDNRLKALQKSAQRELDKINSRLCDLNL